MTKIGNKADDNEKSREGRTDRILKNHLKAEGSINVSSLTEGKYGIYNSGFHLSKKSLWNFFFFSLKGS